MRRIMFLVALAMFLTQPTFTSAAGATDDFTIEAFPHSDVNIEFANDWGRPRSGGRTHKGTDIFSPKGSPVVAVADGFVEYMAKWPTAGFALIIRHADDWSSHYYHLNNDKPGADRGAGGWEAAFAPGLEEGDFVSAGQLVGFVGDSGNAESARAHTHFELHDGSRVVNPFPFLEEAYQRMELLAELESLGIPIE